MLKLEQIEEIIKLAIFSAYIKDEEQPISLLLCCNPEAGKTKQLQQAKLVNGVIMPTDLTAYGILNQYAKDIMERRIRHILIPDLITPLSKRWDTSASLVSFLSSLIEEGILEIRTFAMSEKFKHPVKCGLIACMTPGALDDKRHRWSDMGFMSRMLPVSWNYSKVTQNDIMSYITGRNYKQEKDLNLKLPDKDIEIKLDSTFAQELVPFSFIFAEANKTYGFRYQKHLQRLMMASALSEGREEVTKIDCDKVKSLVQFLNLSQTVL